MKPNLFLLLACFTLHTTAKANTDDSTIVSSYLKNVVVYKAGAEMTHTATAFLKQGNNELVIDNISNQLDINSVQIKTGSAVTVMGIEFSDNYLKNPGQSPQIKFLQDSLDRLQKTIDATNLLIGNDSDLLSVLSTNKDIKGTQTGLSVAELVKLMGYYKTKSLELETHISKLEDKNGKAQDIIDKLQSQIDEEEQKNTSTTGRLTLQLSSAIPGKYDFTISYITQNAYWVPFYDIRVDNIKNPMKIIYKAKITQTTGIDWKQVKLSLSTSLPSQWNNSPVLNTWFLAYQQPVRELNDEVVNVGYGTQLKKDVAGAVSQITIRGVSSLNQPNPLYVVDGNIIGSDDYKKINPDNIKTINVIKDASATKIYGAAAAGGVIKVTLKNSLDDYISVSDNTLDVTFDVDIPYDVPTNGKAQTAILQTMNVPAIYKDFAVPKLDNDPYLMAQVTDWGKLNLLPGEANIIVDNTYIGKSDINPGSTSDTLNFTLGRDKRVVITREKLTDYSSVKFFGGDKLQKFPYEISVQNTKKDSVALLLNDQFPVSTDKDIEVQLIDNCNLPRF
jgi:uncharacterized protein DUF4139/uncharacterized protein DUF4140/TonB-dependent receptor-like protein